MEVKVIDIKVKKMWVPDYIPYLRIPKMEKLRVRHIDEGELPSMSMCNFETLEYPILQMYDPRKGYSYVAVQDKDIFELLMDFKEGRLQSIEHRANINGFNEGYAEGLNNASKRIKKLSWFKRLFNKF